MVVLCFYFIRDQILIVLHHDVLVVHRLYICRYRGRGTCL